MKRNRKDWVAAIGWQMRRLALGCSLAFALATGIACHVAKPRAPEPRPLTDQAALAVIHDVWQKTMEVRGLQKKDELKVFVLDSPTLRYLVDTSFAEAFPERKQHAVERFLRSLNVIPDDMDLKAMYESLLDEQVGGLYDPDTKRLYVREGYDIANSGFARTILSHEMCHVLQDSAFDLKKIGIETPDNDDLAEAVAAVAEGDATVEMGEYAARFELEGILSDMPQQAVMNQSALKAAPYYFSQTLLFPYIQGQLLVWQAMLKGPTWRDYLFTHPPTTTKAVMHPDLYLGHPEAPAPLALMPPPHAKKPPVVAPPLPPAPPRGYRRMETNCLGELGIRLILEERLGMGMATMAAEGWAGDAYRICETPDGRSWFCLETAWDTPHDAEEFLGAWVTLWRCITADPALGDLRAPHQDFVAGPWNVHIESAGKRLVCVWSN